MAVYVCVQRMLMLNEVLVRHDHQVVTVGSTQDY